MKTIEISLKEMMIYVLYRWVPILVIALAVAVLLGGNTYFSSLRGYSYEAALMVYDENLKSAQTSAQVSIASLMEKKIATEDYIRELSTDASPNKQISNLSVRILYDKVYVDITPVHQKYLDLFKNASLVDIFKETLPSIYSEDELRKMVTINEDYLGNVNKDDQSILLIRARGKKDFDPILATEAVYGYLSKNQESVSSLAGLNKLTILEQSSLNYEEAKSVFADNLTQQHDLIDAYDKEMAGINDGVVKMLGKRPDKLDWVMELLGSMAFGAAIGAVLGSIVAAIVYIYKLPVLIPEQIQNQLGVRYFGGIRRKRGVFLGKLGDHIAGKFLLFSDKRTAIDIISANIDAFLSHNKLVLITGSLPLSEITDFSQELTDSYSREDTAFNIGSDINTSATTIRMLAESDSVILVERLQKSTLRKVKQEKDRIDASGKQILGYVLY